MSDKPHHRPPIYGESMKRKQVHLPPHMIEYAKELGGTLAEGVRICIQRDMEEREDNVKKE